jgi:DNA repair exonuclease SbcCD nuclease subunit
MKLCILGDSHFGARGDSLDFHKYFQRFYDDVFFPYLKENDIEVVVQMGDLFDRRKFINFNSLYLSRKYFFDKLRDNNIQLYALVGNHDVAFKNTLEVNSPALLLNEYENVFLAENFHTENFDGVDIDFIPWICDSNEDDIFQKMKKSKSQICFGHFEIAGFEMDKGNICEEGLDKKTLDKYDVVLSGHFHHKSTDGNITYVGTPYEMTWADYNDAKGFHIFDTATRDLEFIENIYSMFHKLNYDDTERDFEHWKSFNFEKMKNSYVKLVVINKQNPYLFDYVLDNLYKAGVSDISIVEDFNDLSLVDDAEIINQAEDTMTILSKYIDNLTLDVEPEKLKSLMRELYVEALNTSEVAE